MHQQHGVRMADAKDTQQPSVTHGAAGALDVVGSHLGHGLL